MPLLISALSFLLPVLLLTLLICNKTFSKRSHLPPSPFKLPIIGNLHQLGSLPHQSLAALSRRYGSLMLLQLGQVQTIIVSSPDMAREVMKIQDNIFSNRPSLKVPNRLLYGCKDVAFAPYGQYWRDVRKLSVLHLLSPQKIKSYHVIREEEVAFMIKKISDLSSLGSVINLSEILTSFAKDVVSKIAFGRCSREEGWNEVVDVLVKECNDLLGSVHLGDYIPWLSWVSVLTGLEARVEKTFGKLDEILEKIVENANGRQVKGDGHVKNTFIDILLSLAKEHKEFRLSKECIKALMEDMFGAGTDSTIIVLEWCMAELIRNPKVMKKLQDEVRGIANPSFIVKEDDLNRMIYLKVVIKETMRLHPPGPLLIPRESVENTCIKGYTIPKQTRVIINAWAIGRDPTYWEAPEEFRPERFFSSPVEFKGHDFQLIPFGAGRRICPGIQFAMSVVELALANLVLQFDWKLHNGRNEDMNMEEAPGITCRKRIHLHSVTTPYSF